VSDRGIHRLLYPNHLCHGQVSLKTGEAVRSWDCAAALREFRRGSSSHLTPSYFEGWKVLQSVSETARTWCSVPML